MLQLFTSLVAAVRFQELVAAFDMNKPVVPIIMDDIVRPHLLPVHVPAGMMGGDDWA